MSQHAPSLKQDQRGAIMVVGVFMACFLVAMLWYVAGVGNAILFRQRMQDGADAASFAAAVYHARGMNIIAMVNLIMAAILAVLVALKIAYVLLRITEAICAAICAVSLGTSPTCELVPLLEDAAETVDDVIKTVAPIVHNTLKALSKLEVGVAYAIPWLAEKKAYDVAVGTQKPVEGGLMLSESLIPGGGKLGLPVEEDTYSVLCDHAVTVVADVALAPFAAFGLPTGWAQGLVKGFVDIAPGYFCDGGGGGGSGNLGGQAGAVCKAQAKAVKEANDANAKLPKDKQKPPQKFDQKKCMDEQTKKLQQVNMPSNGGGNTDGQTPKKVYASASAGDRYFNVTSYAWGDMKITRMANKRVGMAAWGKKLVSVPKYWGMVQFSNAEFYYDQAGTWDDMKDDAMWNMRWRARMRRYHDETAPDHGIINKVGSVVNLGLGVLDAVNMYQAGGLSGLAGEALLSDKKKRLTDIYVRDAKKTVGGGGFEKLDRDSKMEAIH
jgi:hypothetical protein